VTAALRRRLLACALLAAASGLGLPGTEAGGVRPKAPRVRKVEPPSWWLGHSLNPVRLLLRGSNLAGARVAAAPGLSVGAPVVSASGTSLFVDVTLDGSAAPGVRRLGITTPGGRAEAVFELLPPLVREGRFQGIGSDDVIYLLMPDRFANGDPSNDDPGARGLHDRSKPRFYHGGDFAGVIARLPYLKDLGATALWLNPVYDNANRLNERETYDGQPITDYHGYGAVDFYAVDEHFGDLPGLRRLVDEAHRAGLKVIQDQVVNHSGPYHEWVADPPTPGWLNGSEASHLKNTWQTWTITDPHATEHLRRETLEGWFADILPDLNQNDPEAARYLIQNSLWWVGSAGFDAIRQDTLPYVPRSFWSQWTAALRREHPQLDVIGEMWDGNAALVSFFQGGVARAGIDTGVGALFDFPLYYPLRRAFAQGSPLREVASTLALDRLYPNPGSLVTFLGLHDVERFMNEKGATTEGLKLGFTFLMTTRGIPLVYYGDEIALPGGGDPDNRRDFPGGWPGDPRNAFEPAGRTPEQQAVFEHLRALARLRAELAPLRRGRLVQLSVGEQTYAYARVGEDQSVLVALNNDTRPVELEVPVAAAGFADGASLRDRLGAGAGMSVAGGRVRLLLPARGAAVYTAETP